ncbi:MAG TPA: YciI family protein [Candidatus Dormibacteraeota bacterium]|nr:YciI family protein [Candidatus Dormibacteraeota bacterium]
MRFLGYTLGDDSTPLPQPTPELFAEMGRFMGEATQAGVLVATGGLAPSSQGTTIRLENGRFSVTDGPYAESKELIGGWALLDCASKEEAIEWSKRFLQVAGGGETRLRQVFGPDDAPPQGA